MLGIFSNLSGFLEIDVGLLSEDALLQNLGHLGAGRGHTRGGRWDVRILRLQQNFLIKAKISSNSVKFAHINLERIHPISGETRKILQEGNCEQTPQNPDSPHPTFKVLPSTVASLLESIVTESLSARQPTSENKSGNDRLGNREKIENETSVLQMGGHCFLRRARNTQSVYCSAQTRTNAHIARFRFSALIFVVFSRFLKFYLAIRAFRNARNLITEDSMQNR